MEKELYPIYGLSSGMMRFEPGSLFLWIDQDKEEIKSLFSEVQNIENIAKQNLLEIHNPAQLIKKTQRGIDISEKTILFISRLRHETDHLRRHLGTSFGLFYHYLNSTFPRIFSNWFRSSLDLDIEKPFPVIDIQNKLLLKTNKIDEILSQLPKERVGSILSLACLVDFMSCLDGDKTENDELLIKIALLTIERDLSTFKIGNNKSRKCKVEMNSCPKQHLLNYYYLKSPYCPQIFGEPLGAKHLLEALAILSEFSLGTLLGIKEENWVDVLGMRDYNLILNFWHQFFGQNKAYYYRCIKELVNPHLVKNGLPPNGKKRFYPIEFFVALDLALWIPVTPMGFKSPSDIISWQDIHPGWRFIKICHQLRSSFSGWQEIPNSLEESDSLFRKIQDDLCDKLGWPKVHDLIKEWMLFLTDAATKGTSKDFFLEIGPKHPRYVSSLSLLTMRLDKPYSTCLNYLDMSSLNLTWFPIVIGRNGVLDCTIRNQMWKSGVFDEYEKYVSYLMIHGARMLMEGVELNSHILDEHKILIIDFLDWYSNYRLGTPIGELIKHVNIF